MEEHRPKQPHILVAGGHRRFACSPVALLVFIVNDREEVLLLAHPRRGGAWEVVNRALEAGRARLLIPPGQTWLLRRAQALARVRRSPAVPTRLTAPCFR